MLKNPNVPALHNNIRLLMLQQHPYYRGFRHKCLDPGKELPVSFLVHDQLRKTGTVVIIHPLHSGPDLRAAHGGCKHSQISALGMPSQNKRPLKPSCTALQIVPGKPLRRNRILKTHIEIFLPPHQRVVCAPVCQKRPLFPQ